MNAYLFVHFTGTESSEDHEQVYFSVSEDGEKWNILNNGNPILRSNISEKGVRDPFIIRSPKNDKFYIIATDLSIYHRKQKVDAKTAWAQCKTKREDNPNHGSNKMVIWESRDLANWGEARLATASPEDAGCFWAPKCIWDKERNAYMVEGASCTSMDNYALLRLYRSYTTDFINFTEPELYMDESENNLPVFDVTIIEDGEKYYRFYKTDRIKIDSASSLSGEWTMVDTNIHLVAPIHEGPAICKKDDNSWVLMLDNLATHGGYQSFVTDNLSGGQFEMTEVSFPDEVKYRHGSLIQITREEYDRLVEKYKI